jgi:hypothetical protein
MSPESRAAIFALYEEMDDGDDESTARAVLTKLRVNQHATAHILPVIVEDVQHWRRARQRRAEEEAMGATLQIKRELRRESAQRAQDAGVRTGPQVRSDRFKELIEQMRPLAAIPFALYDGTSVTWGEATIEQHELRAKRQRMNAAGSLRDAERHEAMIALLRSTDAKCFDDVLAREAA